MDIPLIIDRIVPEAQFTQYGTYEDLRRTWTDSRPIPTQSDIATEWAVYLQEKQANQYAEDRRKEYPSLVDQVEAIMDHLAGNSKKLDNLKVKINTVKNKHPKPAQRGQSWLQNPAN